MFQIWLHTVVKAHDSLCAFALFKSPSSDHNGLDNDKSMVSVYSVTEFPNLQPGFCDIFHHSLLIPHEQ